MCSSWKRGLLGLDKSKVIRYIKYCIFKSTNINLSIGALMDHGINHSNKAIPLYYQLETILRKKIVAGEFTPGDLFPGEEALATAYGVSRVTVRQALYCLEKDGLISRKRGKGTFVSEKLGSVAPPKLTGFIEDLISMGIRTSVKVIDICMVEAPEIIKERLRLTEMRQVLRVEKVRLIEGSPFSHVLNYLPPDIGQKIKPDDFALKPLLMILEENFGIRPAQAIQTIEATIADSLVASLLEIRVGDPLLKVERVVFDVNEKPVEYVSSLYRADKYFYTVKLKRRKLKSSGAWGMV